MRRVAAVITVVGALALLPSCSSGHGPGKGEAFLHVDGIARVVGAAGTRTTVTRKATVHDGDTVTLVQGTGELELPAGASLSLREGRADAADSSVRVGSVPALRAGEMLVDAPGTLEVSAAGTTATVDSGTAKVSRSLAVGVAAYRGTATVDSAGVRRTIPALRQVDVPALGRVPRALRPVSYDAADPWDRRFLGAAMDVGDRLQNLSRAYTASLAAPGSRDASFFRDVLPGLREVPGFGDQLLAASPERAPGETLVGAAIAAMGRVGAFTHRWDSVFAFRDIGAPWGLVVLDQRVSGSSVLHAVEAAVNASPFRFASLAAAPTSPRSTPTTIGGLSSAGPTPTTAPPTAPTSPTTPPTTPPPASPLPPPTTPPPPDTPPQADPIVQPVEDVLSGVVGQTVGSEGVIPILGGASIP